MDDVRPAELPHQQRQVRELCRHGPHVLDLDETGERSWRNGVDGDEPGLHFGIIVPGVHQPGGLDSLATKDPHGWCNDRDLQPMATSGICLTLHVFFA